MPFHRSDERPLVWAHRGASAYAPENTMSAFEKAVALKADGIELDVQLTRDDEIVVIHDETLGRVSDGKGWVKDHTLAGLRAYNYNRTNPSFPHEDIPTLSQVLELLRPTDMVLNIELKTGMVFYPELEEKVVRLVHDMGMDRQVLYSSFNHYTCMKLHELNPGAYVGFLYADGMIDAVNYAKIHGANALHPALYNIQFAGYMEEAAAAGLDVNVWTVNTEDHMIVSCRAGVNAIITNYPDRALRVAERYGKREA